MTAIISVANQKGGVGKTATTLNLAAAIAQSGRRVLVIDMDHQSNASTTLLADYRDRMNADDFFTTNDLLEPDADPAELADYIQESTWGLDVDVIPSERVLENRVAEIAPGIELRLRRMLNKGLPSLARPYDTILIDCPPAAGSRTALNAFLASTQMLLVLGPDAYGAQALSAVGRTLRDLDKVYEHHVEVAGVVINMTDETVEARERTRLLQEVCGERLLPSIQRRQAIRVAAGASQSVFESPRREAPEVAAMYVALAERMGLLGGPGVAAPPLLHEVIERIAEIDTPSPDADVAAEDGTWVSAGEQAVGS